MPGNPYEGHSLATVIPEIEASIGTNLIGIVADAGYRGHDAPKDKTFKVYVAGQKARPDRRHQARLQTAIGYRARHRPSQK